mmetsp:Transcript_3301/g.11605  ORF Transcript_3301/g.11605 Transcript_3301/m.11605 type:complete len:217 (+) Transcript_3301:3325-3975(+)
MASGSLPASPAAVWAASWAAAALRITARAAFSSAFCRLAFRLSTLETAESSCLCRSSLPLVAPRSSTSRVAILAAVSAARLVEALSASLLLPDSSRSCFWALAQLSLICWLSCSSLSLSLAQSFSCSPYLWIRDSAEACWRCFSATACVTSAVSLFSDLARSSFSAAREAFLSLSLLRSSLLTSRSKLRSLILCSCWVSFWISEAFLWTRPSISLP